MKKAFLSALVCAFMMATLFGCASSPQADNAAATYYAEGKAAAASEQAEEPEYAASPQESAAPNDSGSGINYDGLVLQPDVNRKIVFNASFQIQTKNFDDDYNRIIGMMKELGGYIESSSVSGSKPEEWTDTGRHASLTLRVPSGKFNDFTTRLGEYGKTVQSSISGRDISLEYFDTETKLKTLRTRESRLLELLEKAATLEDIVQLESALADVSYQIQMLETNLRDYDSLIDYSTVTIELQEVNQVQNVTSPSEDLGTRIGNAFYSVLNAVADFGEFLLIFLVGGAPVIVPLAAIIVLIVVIVKRRKKKAVNSQQPQNPI